jgi:predicted O-methyltransferase YrrM
MGNRFQQGVVAVLAKLMAKYARGENYARYFSLWERHGFHVTPNHFYSPIPDTRVLCGDIWEKASEMVGIDMNEEKQLALLHHVFPKYRGEYNAFPRERTKIPHEFHYHNGMFDGMDAVALYCMVRHVQPRHLIEVGSGYSTRVAAEGCRRNGTTQLVCIEPYPDEILQKGFPGLSELMARKVEQVGLEVFARLDDGDVLFIDTSHVVKCGGDVNYLYLEVIPRLKKGVYVHVHDIFFPKEYPREWVMRERRFWTEQYLLHAFFAFNAAFEVVFCNSYMDFKYPRDMQAILPDAFPWSGGGSFWMRRKSELHPTRVPFGRL